MGGAYGSHLWLGPAPLLPGIQRFCRDIHMMLGFKPGIYFRACWLFLTPATLLVTGVGGRAAGWGPESRVPLGIQSGRAEGWAGHQHQAYSPPQDVPSLCVCAGPRPQFSWQNECSFLRPLGLRAGP